MRVALVVVCSLLAASCASIRDAETHPHPTPNNRLAACYLSCPEGWMNERMHECRGGRMWMQDILLTGEDDVPGDPAESRWFTGLASFGADFVVRERLAAAGVREFILVDHDGLPVKETNPEWPHRYMAEMKRVEREMGDESRAAYPKRDVVLMRCEAFKRQRCMSKAATVNPCDADPGTPDPITGVIRR